MPKRIALVAFLFVCLGLSAAAEELAVLSGRLSVLRGDRADASAAAPAPRFSLSVIDGREVRLLIDEDLGAARFNKQRVSVTGEWNGETFAVATIELARDATGEDAPTPISGTQGWVTVMCKFQDLAEEQKPLSYFEGMYDSLFPGFDHHWREQSYGAINLTGSSASGWHTLPHPRSYYVTDYDSDGIADYADLHTLRDDCLSAARISYAQYVGINMMFNAELDGNAWGGSSYLYLGGIYRSWYLTWNPPWAFNNIATVGHEMGHGFGLPHSTNKWSDPYANRWDVMSDTKTDCILLTNPVYGCLPQHTIGHHKDLLGWIPAEKKFTFGGGETTINLERIAQPQANNNYLLAKIPIDATRFYTVEVRQKIGYDVRVPVEGVVIHRVDPSLNDPAYVIDADGDGNTVDAAWLVGQTFHDEANGIAIRVEAAITNGYRVKLTKVTPTKTTLTSSLTNGLPTTQVAFTASVNLGATGTVTFSDNGVETVTVPLSNGTAVWNTTRPHGMHSITAVYKGSSTHGQSTSNAVSYLVGNTQVSINDVTVSEGNSGTNNAVFTVTAVQPEGQPTITYRVIDGSAIGTRLGINATPIAIPGATNPSTINLAGSNSVISKLTVTLNRLEHTNPADIDMVLVGPNGTGVVLMSDAGGGADVFNVVLTFDDAAPFALNPLNLPPGTFRPTDFDGGLPDSFGSPAPYSTLATSLSAFNGLSPNGLWSLYIVDDTSGEAGVLQGGWTLNIETNGSDYNEAAGTLVMPAGATTATIAVPVKGDTKAEGDETFAVIITSTNAYVADGSGLGTILNDDGPVIAAPANVTATAIGPTQVGLTWSSVAQATGYRIYRSSNGTSYAPVGTSGSPSFTDTTAAANTAYLYKVHSLNDDSESAGSNADLATTVLFTDSVLTSSTPVRRAHFTELLTAINAVRTLAGMSAASFGGPAPVSGGIVRRSHLVDLRNALAAARSALALPAASLADDDVAAGVTPIRAAHVTDLRNGVM
jgi:subtilisin-like proprotein convertase family protein